ncbi:RraA family protein [Candidatus Latescibacterota bacterium]
MKRAKSVSVLFTAIMAVLILLPVGAAAQDVVMSREDIIALTPEWEGERFPDGRPKVPDEILERMKTVDIEEAWATVQRRYKLNFEGNWEHTHLVPDGVLVGRALTATFVPIRPDIDKVLTEKGQADGHIGGRNSWPIDMLQQGDVYVANAYGSVVWGPIIGGNLGTAIYRNSGNGIVFDGTIRDLAQIQGIDGFYGYVRGWHPSWNQDNMLVEINHPTRIGNVCVMPGDVVLGRREGVCFIPPHLAEQVCEMSERTRLRDEFGFLRINQGVYTPGQIDQGWTPEMNKDHLQWLEENADNLSVAKEQVLQIIESLKNPPQRRGTRGPQ